MSSDELWHFIHTGSAAEHWQIQQIKATLAKAEQADKIARALEIIGVYVGLFVVLCIYGAFFWLISKLFYPLSILQALALSIGIFLISKILTIPTIRFWESRGPNGKI